MNTWKRITLATLCLASTACAEPEPVHGFKVFEDKDRNVVCYIRDSDGDFDCVALPNREGPPDWWVRPYPESADPKMPASPPPVTICGKNCTTKSVIDLEDGEKGYIMPWQVARDNCGKLWLRHAAVVTEYDKGEGRTVAIKKGGVCFHVWAGNDNQAKFKKIEAGDPDWEIEVCER